MTHKKLRPRKSAWIILAIVIIAVCTGIYFLNHKTTASVNDTYDPEPSASSSAESTPDKLVVTSDVSTVYKLNDIDFAFVIAKFHVETPTAVNVSLDHFTTSEGIKLSDVQEYVDVLEENKYSLTSAKVVSSLTSAATRFDANVFIPVKDKTAESITITNDLDSSSIKIDLRNSNSTADALKAADNEPTADAGNYSISVSYFTEVSSSEILTTGDQPYTLPSTARVFVFHVNVTAAKGKPVKIVAAKLATDTEGTVKMESASIHTNGCTSILEQEIADSGEGYLFATFLDPGYTIKSMNGTVTLQMADESQDTTANVTIN